MNAYERLMAEAIPTGTFGHAQPTRSQKTAPAPAPTWALEEQTAHLAELNAALNGWHDTSDHAIRDRQRHQPKPRLREHRPAA